MHRPIPLSTATPPFPKLICRSHLGRSFSVVLLAFALGSFALSQMARAVTPAPDGGYPGGNTAEGDEALHNLTSGIANTANGQDALFDNTTGSDNTAIGADALIANETGGNNTAIGAAALNQNKTASNNTATGANALASNTTADNNTATGFEALSSNTTGVDNTGNGAFALESNTTGNSNTGTGVDALFSNTTGTNNTANGQSALQSNTTASNNSAFGTFALFANTTGGKNTGVGFDALENNTVGANNTASGYAALQLNTGSNNTACGESALGNNKGGSSNIGLGTNAGVNLTTGSNNIDIGNKGVAGEAAKIRIGTVGTQTAAFIAGISGKAVASGVGVLINTNGQLGTVVSSARFKEAIKPMDKASEAILALKPVSFRYKEELDPEAIPQFGLIAEEVEKVNPALLVRGEDGRVMTVRYEAVNAMLLNEFIKAHSRMEEQDRTLKEQADTIAQQQKQITDLTSAMQRVSDKIKLNSSANRRVGEE